MNRAEPGVTAPSSNPHTLEDELLLTLSRQSRRVPFAVFVAMALIGWMAVPRAPQWALGWLLLVTAVLALRWWVLERLPGATQWPARTRLQVAVALSALNGVAHSLSLAFAPGFSDYERAVQSVVLLGLAAGAVATTAGYLPVFLAYLLPTALSLAASWALVYMPDGALPVQWTMTLLILLFGLVLVALARDVFRLYTDLFAAQQLQRESHRQVSAALAEAESANSAKTRFLFSASHDLRQPLHTLAMFSESLLRHPLDAGARNIAARMDRSLQALLLQMNALLDIGRLDPKVMEVRPAPVSLSALAERLGAEFAPLAERKGLALHLAIPPGATARTDALLIERLLRNLLDNALKYTDTGHVSLAIRPSPMGWAVEVADSGRGIALVDHERVFEEFYQIDNPEHDRSKGLGLGLFIVKRMIALLDLRLELDSAPGRGTRLTVHLAAAPAEPPPLLPPPPPLDEEPSLEGATILVLDDEEDVRIGMNLLIRTLGGRALLARNGEEALALLAGARPDAVVVDFRLAGGEDGLQAVARRRERVPNLAALLVSGDTGPERQKQAQRAGIRLLGKPVPRGQLMRELHALAHIRRPEDAEQPAQLST